MYKSQVIVEKHKAHDSAIAILFQRGTANRAALKGIPAPCEAFSEGFMVILRFPNGVGKLEFLVGNSLATGSAYEAGCNS